MKTESILLDGTQAKQFNDLCRQFDSLKAEYAEIKEKWDALTEELKAFSNGNKTVETTTFVVNYKVTGETTILDTKAIKEKYPEIAEQCQKVKKGSIAIQEVLKK